jgi:formiminoglutamase
MDAYTLPSMDLWTGRKSKEQLYLHEKVTPVALDNLRESKNPKSIAILGYSCDEGVRRNLGRPGAKLGPNVIREQLAKMPNHLAHNTQLLDVGNIHCDDGILEESQNQLAKASLNLLQHNYRPILLGGGHDMAYGHLMGIKKYLGTGTKLGVINFDAHFDLRDSTVGANSGTPFDQYAKICRDDASTFHYLALGIRQDANDRALFQQASKWGAQYVEQEYFNMHFLEHVQLRLIQFMEDVDSIYTTIDLDGFASAFAPGVSAASPMGFTPDIVLECLKLILDSKKLISLDIAEMNPSFDVDGQTAKLAASLVHYIIHRR